ncbi:MAG: dTMP kinase [Prochlorococcus sp. SP3034]|nr:dTMP kinase [Prochlorococcus sp. SP3034]|tara:strand:+ start:5027 stop:5662 length:636 start_codon:yes stop_codon:yes gene_type:complete
MRGKFIVIEGIDGCGKTTQIEALSKWLPQSGLMNKNSTLIKTREPGGTPFGEKLREIILHNDKTNTPSDLTELLLYAADRAEHVSKVISPELNKNNWVISDRFADSTLAYQGYGRNINREIIKRLESIVCQGEKPDVTFLLDISPEESIRRRKNEVPDRIESEGIAFLKNVNQGFKEIAKEKKWDVISALQDADSIANQIKEKLLNISLRN